MGTIENITEKIIETKDILTKSNLPASDYVINLYVGCPHGCKYCYARFMKRFTGHSENWGDFIDIKICQKPINLKKIEHKSVFLSSVTDCYNPYEEKYRLTRQILEQLQEADCELAISTKSELILRDIDLLKNIKNLTVAVSMNTLDEEFRKDMDNASSIERRIATLEALHKEGIKTVLFMSPIFPYITDFKAIIERTSEFVSQYWFENLNLRGEFKAKIMEYIAEKYPQYISLYKQIYTSKNMDYWTTLAKEIDEYCKTGNISFINYFYHSQLVADKKEKESCMSGISRYKK